jgi:hypothetical protein
VKYDRSKQFQPAPTAETHPYTTGPLSVSGNIQDRLNGLPFQPATNEETHPYTTGPLSVSGNIQDRLNGLPFQQYGSAPEPVQQSSSAPEPVQQSSSAPEPVQQSSSAPEPVQQSSSTPEPVQQSSSTPAPVQQSSSTPEPVQQSSSTPAPVQQSSSTPAPVQPAPTGSTGLDVPTAIGGGTAIGLTSAALQSGGGAPKHLMRNDPIDLGYDVMNHRYTPGTGPTFSEKLKGMFDRSKVNPRYPSERTSSGFERLFNVPQGTPGTRMSQFQRLMKSPLTHPVTHGAAATAAYLALIKLMRSGMLDENTANEILKKQLAQNPGQ